MAVALRTISFRVPEDFPVRLDRARAALAALHDGGENEPVDAWLVTEFEMALARKIPSLTQSGSPGAFVRDAMAALLDATERVERELGRMEEFRAFGEHDLEGDDLRRAALRAATPAEE